MLKKYIHTKMFNILKIPLKNLRINFFKFNKLKNMLRELSEIMNLQRFYQAKYQNLLVTNILILLNILNHKIL